MRNEAAARIRSSRRPGRGVVPAAPPLARTVRACTAEVGPTLPASRAGGVAARSPESVGRALVDAVRCVPAPASGGHARVADGGRTGPGATALGRVPAGVASGRSTAGTAGREAADAVPARRSRTGAGSTAPGVRGYRPVRAPVTRRPACLGTPGLRAPARRRRVRGRSRLERFLIGAAVALCSATVVVFLGLVADLAAGAQAAPAPPSISVAP